MTQVRTDAMDVPRLTAWMNDHVGTEVGGPLEVELIAGGRSNLTFGISVGDRRLVLRRPPLGHILPTAHDMQREFTVLSALRDTDVPVPEVLALCMDPEIIGSPFYLMERVEGFVMRSAEDSRRLSVEQAGRLSLDLAEVLARVHNVPWQSHGLADFGRPDGFLERQIARWTAQWEKSKTRDLPGIDEMARILRAHLPRPQQAALVHGDYRLDNIMLSPDALSPVAVLDWEMSTVGDPLADLGLLMVYWADADDTFPSPSVARQVAAGSGFLTRAEMAEAYSRASGRDVSDLPFYVVLGYFKLAIIFEGIHRRHTMGQTVGEGFEGLGDEVPQLVDAGLASGRGMW